MRGNNSVRYIGRFESAWPITATDGGKRGSFGTESMRVFAFINLITVTVTCSYTFRRLKQVSLQSIRILLRQQYNNESSCGMFTYSGDSKDRSCVTGGRTAQLSAPSLCDLQFAFLSLRTES